MQICKNIQLKGGITGTKVSQNVVSKASNAFFSRNILWITIIEIFIKYKRRSGKQDGAVREKSLKINET